MPKVENEKNNTASKSGLIKVIISDIGENYKG